MDFAALVRNQTLQTLLAALDGEGALMPNRTVEARLTALAPDGTATAMVGDRRIALRLEGPQARQAPLQPGATLTLKIDESGPDGTLRATLVEVRPPAGQAGNTPMEGATPRAQPRPVAPGAATGLPNERAGTLPQAAPSLPPPAAQVRLSIYERPLAAAPTPVTTAPASPPAATAAQPSSSSPAAPAQAAPAAGLPAAMAQATATAPASTAVRTAMQDVPEPALPAPHAPPAMPANSPQAPTASASAGLAPRAAVATQVKPTPGVPVPAQPALTPEAARAVAGPLLATALARQDSLAPLLANLLVLARGAVAMTLPRPLLAAAETILAQAVPAQNGAPKPEALQRAFAASGLFAESRAAAGAMPEKAMPDMKAALTVLRDLLAPAREEPRPAARAAAADTALPAAAGERPAPPRRDALPHPQPLAEPTLGPGEKPATIAATLLEQAEAALDRIKLSQFASLPADRSHPEQAAQQRWHAEIPLALQSGIAMLPLQVERDASQRETQGASGPLWKIRFALDIEPLGPMHGLVTLRGREVGVRLWAEREQAASGLRARAADLEAALEAASFVGGAIEISNGRPAAAQPVAGQFLDRMS